MSDTDECKQALRAREVAIGNEIALLQAKRDEVRHAIAIVERAGWKKPGPKAGGTRLATAELAAVAADEEREP